MPYRQYLFIVALCLTPAMRSFAQAPPEPYQSEFIGGINLNTNGGIIGGVMARYAWFVKENHYHTIGVEIVNVKHPKEIKYASPVTGNVFIGGKQNYLFVIRPHFGRNLVLFGKAHEEGIQVDAVLAVGPSLGIVKPYMIEYDYYSHSQIEPFDPKRHTDFNRILGSGGFFSGFGGSKIVPGIHVKAGLSFEFGNFSHNISGIEAGVMVESYPKEISLIPYAHNKASFSSVYINIFYGSRR